MTRVSVIIPAYNSGRFIGAALESVREQTLTGVEVIVVDDGSSDDTLAVVERFAGSMQLRVLRQANAGPAAARNNGVRASQAQYCAFLDADDLMLPSRLAEQAALLDADATMALVHTDLMTFDERGVIHASRRAFSDPRGGAVLYDLLLDNFITTSTVMARRDRLLEAGLFREGRHISEDFELWLKLAERWRVGYIDHPLAKYRYTPGSLSGNKVATALAALEVVREFWADHPQHRARRPDVFRRSLSRHLMVVGWAQQRAGQRAAAARHLFSALRLDPLDRKSWKGLAKTLLARAPPATVPRIDAGNVSAK